MYDMSWTSNCKYENVKSEIAEKHPLDSVHLMAKQYLVLHLVLHLKNPLGGVILVWCCRRSLQRSAPLLRCHLYLATMRRLHLYPVR